jgi:hypothetical protein
MSEQKQHPDAPQVAVTRELDKLTVSADMKVQARQYESVGAFRSYSYNIADGDDIFINDIERDMIEKAVAIAALTTDIQLAVGFEQAPRFRKLWEDWAHLCPENWQAAIGIGKTCCETCGKDVVMPIQEIGLFDYCTNCIDDDEITEEELDEANEAINPEDRY